MLEDLKKMSGIDIPWKKHKLFNNVWCAEVFETLFTLSEIIIPGFYNNDELLYVEWTKSGSFKNRIEFDINDYESILSAYAFGDPLSYIDKNSKAYSLTYKRASERKSIIHFNHFYSDKGLLFDTFKNNKK